MDRVVKMMLSGMNEQQIRQDLDEFLSTQRQSGGVGERGKVSYTMAISILACWFAPAPDLKDFRDRLLLEAGKRPQQEWLTLHWAMISATYPFWLNVARQVGRLFNLQEQITQPQIFNRIKEQYGDRETVARNARYVVRSFVAWGIIQDTPTKGSYSMSSSLAILDKNMTILLFESLMHTLVDGKVTLSNAYSDPAFFAFELSRPSASEISYTTKKIDVTNLGLDDFVLHICSDNLR